MAYRPTLPAREALNAVAVRQGGYVTSRQAREAGYGPSHVAYHVETGALLRVGHGLYRVAAVPPHEHDDLIRLALWSRGRDDRPRAVVSHDTALFLHGLSDVLPASVHLTVPPRFRKVPPTGCVLHVGSVPAPERRAWTVFSVTTPGRTLADAAESASVPREQLELALTQALQEGLVTRKDLRRRAEEKPRGRLARMLADAVG